MDIDVHSLSYDDDWARKVHAALVRYYGVKDKAYDHTFMRAFRIIAGGGFSMQERRQEAEALRERLGIVPQGQSAEALQHDFTQALVSLMFLHALPITRDKSGGMQFLVKDYIELQERFGDDDVLAGKLRVVGIDPLKVMHEQGRFVLPKERAEQVDAFMQGEPRREVISVGGDGKRYDLIVRNATAMQHYKQMVPHICAKMYGAVHSSHPRLAGKHPEIVELLARGDMTLVNDGHASLSEAFATDSAEALNRLVGVLKETYSDPYYYKLPPSQEEAAERASKELHALQEKFSSIVRAHMSINKLTFFDHWLQRSEPTEQHKERAFSIDVKALMPWLKSTRPMDVQEYFNALGVSWKYVRVLKTQEPGGGVAERVCVHGEKTLEKLSSLGVQTEPVTNVYQIGEDLATRHQRKQRPPVTNEAMRSVLPMDDWKAKVEARRACKAEKEREK